jgi:hypothetical protein
MSLIFVDGFDHYATADLPKKWQISDSPAILTTGGRRGGGALTTASAGQAYKYFPLNYTTLIIGFSMKYTGSPNSSRGEFLRIFDSAVQHLSVVVTFTGAVNVLRGSSSGTLLGSSAAAILQAGAENYIEVKAFIHDSAGMVEVRVNGVPVLTLTDQDTRNGGLASANGFALGQWVNFVTYTFDDLYVCDNSGSLNSDFLGDCRVDTLYPNADGTYSDLACSIGTAHYSLVDDPTLTTGDYVSGGTVGMKDSYEFTNIVTAAAIHGVQLVNCSMKDDSGPRSVANIVRSAGADTTSAPMPLTLAPSFYVSLYETDPATSVAWTQAAINAVQFGTVVAA